MAGKVEEQTTRTESEITFKCRFCGENHPLREMIILKQYFPQLVACVNCAKLTRRTSAAENDSTDKES